MRFRFIARELSRLQQQTLALCPESSFVFVRFVVKNLTYLFLAVVVAGSVVGCGGGSDVTTVTPEDQKMLDASHAQAGDAMKGASSASKGIRPGGHN